MPSHNPIVRGFPTPSLAPAYDPAQHQYPKAVYPNGPDMPMVRANSAEEEAEIMGATKIDAVDEKARLTAVAERHGLVLDGRWKIERIKSVISNAGYNPDEAV